MGNPPFMVAVLIENGYFSLGLPARYADFSRNQLGSQERRVARTMEREQDTRLGLVPSQGPKR